MGPQAAPNPGALRALSALALASTLAAGCRSEGAPFACECDMLTDFDDAHKETVKVCARDASEAPSVAQGCAQLAAPMPVQRCACSPAKDAPPTCKEGCLQ
jgi:hypothetical protein